MRKEKRQAASAARPQLARVQRYHEGGNWSLHDESYAFAGFRENLYFTSDRAVKLTEDFQRPDGKPLKGYGLEIETECNSISDQTVLAEVYENIIFPHFPASLFKMQHDGSLGGQTSAECITQIMTREAVRNCYPAFKVMFNTYFKAFQISASESGRCGMHTNISLGCFGTTEAAQEEAVRKLYYFINSNFRLSCALFARREDCTGYCAKMDENAAQTMDVHNMPCSHGICFNLGHYDAGRIEIRLVGGQKDFGQFRNTMETIFWLVDIMKRISWKSLQEKDFVRIFAGCNQYVYDRLSSLASRFFSRQQLDEIAEKVVTENLV